MDELSTEKVIELARAAGFQDGWLSLWEDNFSRFAKCLTAALAAQPDAGVDISAMVNRFLGWKLPKDFYPDAGISFKAVHEYDTPYWPTGTNLFTADQAKAMFEYVLAGQTPHPEQDAKDARRMRAIRWCALHIDSPETYKFNEALFRYESEFGRARTEESFNAGLDRGVEMVDAAMQRQEDDHAS
jgi:hypothetical protein